MYTELKIFQIIADFVTDENEIRATKKALQDPEMRSELERIARKLNRQ